jgi:hypothetical protein
MLLLRAAPPSRYLLFLCVFLGCSPNGTFSTGTGGPAVTSCSGTCTATGGTYCPAGATSGTPIGCTFGTYTFPGAAVPVPCPAGSFGDAKLLASSACSGLCPIGKFSEAGAKKCTNCTSGRFSSTMGATQCSPCSTLPGSYCGTGSVGSGGTACPAGTAVGTYNATACEPCPSGRYAPSTMMTECLLCPVGRYAAGNGSVLCDRCQQGRYGDSLGLSSPGCSGVCQAGPGYICGEASVNATGSVCPPGRYSAGGPSATTCINCPGGRWGGSVAPLHCKLAINAFQCELGNLHGLLCGPVCGPYRGL